MTHDITAACQQLKVEQVYIKSKCGHSTLLDTIMCVENCNLHDPLYFAGSKVIWAFVSLCLH